MTGFTLLAAKVIGAIEAGSALDEYLTRLQGRPAFVTAAGKTGNTDV